LNNWEKFINKIYEKRYNGFPKTIVDVEAMEKDGL
jgi:hypothetical protein